MKKFTFILLFPLLIAASNGQLINVLNMYNAAVSCAEGTPSNICVTSSGQNAIAQGYSYGIAFTSTSSYQEWGVSLRLNVSSGSTNVTVRVGTSADLTTYVAQGTATVTSTDTNNYEVVQWDSPITYNGSTYYIGIMPTNGGVNWQRGNDVCSGMSRVYSSAQDWNMNQSDALDPNWKTIPCS